ncbi:MAG: BatA domain-containing protein [bacterium]
MILAFLNVVHPALLWGAALIGVPILIHLLNKRRFRIVEWAAMELLRRVNRKNRRRLLLEDLLILILRCLAVLLLVLLIARLILSASTALARAAGARTERIIILDDSPSMGVRQGNRMLFTRVTTALADCTRKLALRRPGDTLSVILTSTPNQPFLNGQVLGGDRTERVASALGALQVSGVPARFEQAFLSLLRTVGNEPSASRELYIVSDFRRPDWISDSRDGGVPKQLAALAARIPNLTLVNAGQPVATDLAITDARCSDAMLTLGVPAQFQMTVVNRGQRDADGSAVTVSADGAPAGRVNIPAMEPGASRIVSLPIPFSRVGPITVEAELAGNDALAMDDRRVYASSVKAAIQVLVVDGEPDANPLRSESFYLRRALAPPGNRVSGMGVTVVEEDAFDPRGLDGVQVLFLCNVHRLAEEQWRALADWVRRGGGLVVFPGDQVDGASWNERAQATAPGFLPVRFQEMAGDPSEKEWQELRLNRPDHPVLQAFAGERNPFLQRVKVFRFWQLEPLADSAAVVLATFGNGRPALVESLFGTGRVLVFATAADVEWSNWPGDPSYVVTLQQVARAVARVSEPSRVVIVGQSLRHEVSPARYRSEARLFAPGAQEAELLRAAASTNTGQVAFESAPLRQPGVWALELTTHDGEATRVLFAANIAAGESDLSALESGELLRRAGSPGIRFVAGPGLPDLDEAAVKHADLTRLLAVLLMALLVAEQGLAWWFGWRRRAG